MQCVEGIETIIDVSDWKTGARRQWAEAKKGIGAINSAEKAASFANGLSAVSAKLVDEMTAMFEKPRGLIARTVLGEFPAAIDG